MFENIIDQIVPILGIFMIIAIVIGPLWIRSYFAARERAQMHETLRVAYEKGQPVPPELIEKLTAPVQRQSYGGGYGAPDADLRRAIILIAVGLGLVGLGAGLFWGFMYVNPIPAGIIGGSTAGAGAIPGFIGLAYLVLWLAKRSGPRA
ncbi:MAG TPA: DUF6249 domain-containing protein [Caulobacteraceae bacterium]|nr:DUF6249 domain-containing protein [Caulobacteraceae bacterium]